MSGSPMVSPHAGSCPFCGVATKVPHETQEGCIAALHEEIGRMRGILAHLKPTGVPGAASHADENPAPSIGLALNKTELL
jgi:hypothetical protein